MSDVFSRVLVGIDDSDASNEAVAIATRLACEHGGQLILCHSVNWQPLITQMAASGAVVDSTLVVEDLKREGEVLLDRAMASAKRDGVDAQRRALEGEPAQRILELAAEAKCNLIVMGTHGRKGLEHLFLGSTTEAVLRESTIPVLTVRSGTKRAQGMRRCFERMVVGVDESEPSDAAIQTVLKLPHENLRQVYFYSVFGTGEDAREQAERVVGKATALAHARGISAEGCVIGGTPGEALIAAAQQRDADLIVLGSHGRRGLPLLFLGSVAVYVVRNAPLPVLVVRPGESVPVTTARAANREPSRV